MLASCSEGLEVKFTLEAIVPVAIVQCASKEGLDYRRNNSKGEVKEIETDRFLCTRKLSLEGVELGWEKLLI